MRPLHILLAVLLCGLPPAVSAEAARYELDPVHTRVMFAISHAGFSNAIGTVSGSSGELWFDPQDWSGARLRASVPVARLDLGDPEWNRAVLARNLLDAERFPVATFASTRIEPIDAHNAAVYGMLTLRGVTREVKLDVRFNAARRHPLPPFRHTAGFSASATISREDFGIDAWPGVIGDTVQVRIEAEVTRSRGAEEAPPSPPAPAPSETDIEANRTQATAGPPSTQPPPQRAGDDGAATFPPDATP